MILNNRILNSSNEGIVVVSSGRAEIRDNFISANNDGVVVVGCDGLVMKGNQVEGNRSNGVFLQGGAIVEMRENKLQDNDGIGLFIRDSS